MGIFHKYFAKRYSSLHVVQPLEFSLINYQGDILVLEVAGGGPNLYVFKRPWGVVWFKVNIDIRSMINRRIIFEPLKR